jgi:hypothetical protein
MTWVFYIEYLFIFEVKSAAMRRLIFLLPVLLLCLTLTGQDKSEYDPPTNVRYGQEHFPSQVDLYWTPPPGWAQSPVDKWIDWDLGIWGGNALGSCMDCPAEAGSKWDASKISIYDTVYLTKIRYLLTEPQIHYALKVYQGTPDFFDTLMVFPLEENLIYNTFDTLNLDPILLDTSKDLWLVYWVNSLASGYPLPMGNNPAMIGYGNLLNWGPGWDTLTSINPDIDFNWSIGGYLETPNDTVKYPLFNIYRSVDGQPYELMNQELHLDTVFYDFLGFALDPSHLYYYVTCVYEDGESEPSDTLHISFVNTPEIVQNNNIKIFPNPAKDQVSIESAKGKIKSLSLINSKGEMMMEQLYNSEKIEIDVSDLPGSFYIVRMITNDGVFTSKLLILK